jgi:predicted SAM-dependent methyltransferase
MKLHLGCGEKYLEGYINIDFPVGEHTVMNPHADLFADVTTLSYPDNSIDEIRSHHLFEHFSRPEALKLLARWRSWLKPDGLLIIETPDFATSAALFLITTSMRRKMQLSRHIYGSQEANWAYHKDHWDKEKFSFVMKKMGFKNFKAHLYNNGLAQHAEKIPYIGGMFRRLPKGLYNPILNITGTILPESFYKRFGSGKMPNILVKAKKDISKDIDIDGRVREILSLSLNGKEGDRLLNVWMEDYRKF